MLQNKTYIDLEHLRMPWNQNIYVSITFLSNRCFVLKQSYFAKNIALVSESLNNKISIRLGCYKELLTLIVLDFELSKVHISIMKTVIK